MRAQGLSAQADSWVGTGENQPVTGGQMRDVAGDEVSQIAQRAGVSEDEAAEAMAQLLPGLVDSAFDQLQRSASAG